LEIFHAREKKSTAHTLRRIVKNRETVFFLM
jgi:hypothetical protein